MGKGEGSDGCGGNVNILQKCAILDRLQEHNRSICPNHTCGSARVVQMEPPIIKHRMTLRNPPVNLQALKSAGYQLQMGTLAFGRSAPPSLADLHRRFCMSTEVNNPLFHKRTLDHATSPDQRGFRRFGVRLPCRVRPRAPHKRAVLPELKTETVDVSGGGLFFLASAEWAVGTAIEFELDLPTHVVRRPVSIHCQGTITRIVPQKGGRNGIGATIDHYKISASRKASRRAADKAASLKG